MKLLYGLILSFLISAPALAQSVVLPDTSAKQAYVVDFDTGAVLF